MTHGGKENGGGMEPRLSDFIGTWQLSRRIVEADGRCATFTGTACFTPDAEGLSYREEGLLSLPGSPAPIRAERSYLWREDGDEIVVLFGDGRPFHRFAPARPEAAHWCDPDDYRVHYDFSRWPVWRAEWRVKGPRKDYRMSGEYGRAPGAALAKPVLL